jgi:alkylation response protein AidB-like acyl-CoA dehydrogenase
MFVQQPTEEQRLAVESFRKFLESEIRPIAREYRDRHIPKDKMREITQAIAEFGLPGASLPEEFGGMGLSMVTEGMLFEELCTVSLDIGLCVMINKGLPAFLASLPTEQNHLRDKYLSDVLAGRTFGGACISEPDVGSNVADIKTIARATAITSSSTAKRPGSPTATTPTS